ncbi:MAG: hypothetical protein KBD39_04870 [Sterolibacterium sp.]|nr:hypothetical protein [Sterolibacterium sp.]MBP9799433.1 hypothetical protein [Sterolibacterium sp.]
MSILDPQARNLLLACEMAGYLHDLGKLHPGFAREKLDGETAIKEAANRPSTGIGEPHGRILEEGRTYPEASELAGNANLAALLTLLKDDPAWSAALALPEKQVHPETIQAKGLGVALRQHHAQKKFPETELSLLGDIYSFAADLRDSAFDKASGGAKEVAQHARSAEIIDAFGHKRADYSAAALQALWQKAIPQLHALLSATTATANLPRTRQQLLEALKPLLTHALGETRRPTHDVTLHHHALATASFLKAAVAEALLRQDFTRWQDEKGLFNPSRMGQIRFRLLGIRWDWATLTRGMLSAAALVSLSGRRREAVENLRELFEREEALGNLIYEDDDGVLILLPGLHEADSNGQDNPSASEQVFAEKILEPLEARILAALHPLGTGTPVTLCWSQPTLYLTDYADALGVTEHSRRRALQVGVDTLRQLWDAANASGQLMQICPQCGLRPAATREFSLTESSLRNQELCDECAQLSDLEAKRSRGRHLADEFGFRTHSFNITDLARQGGSSRIALIAVGVDTTQIADGRSFLTQLARPVELIKEAATAGIQDANGLGDWFQSLLSDLEKGLTIPDDRAKLARDLLGDGYWLKESDGRAACPLEVARLFFLRESANLPAPWQLARHDGDRLALFALRKHASPARLQRLWSNLRELWRNLAQTIATDLQDNLIPLSLDARGLRLAVAASDADSVIRHIHATQSQMFSKLRGGLALHVSCVVTTAGFPLYLSLDALGRMERRIAQTPHQTWRLESLQQGKAQSQLVWQTPQGVVRWNIDTTTADPDKPDQWHSHFILSQRAGQTLQGPVRLVHVSRLKAGDEVLIPPSTFDFMTLEGSGRRHQLAYTRQGEELRRPHWVMGAAGRPPLLLDTYEDFAALLKTAGWDTGKAKRLMGEMVETYEKWVRDTPAALRDTGRKAWHAHLHNMLQRYAGAAGEQGRQRLFHAIDDGRFFDAIEWLTFIGKTSNPSSTREVRT